MQAAYQLLTYLEDGQWYSRRYLMQVAKLDRPQLDAALAFLIAQELVLEFEKNHAIRWLMPRSLLNKNTIDSQLQPLSRQLIPSLLIFNEISSTNDYFTESYQPAYISGSVCLAESQSQGRGRMLKHWHSPYARHIYMSLYWEFPQAITELSALSLVIGIAIMETITQTLGLPEGLGIKWPNDIFFKQDKIAGILLETRSSQLKNDSSGVVIGIGLNVHPIAGRQSLEQIFNLPLCRNILVANLLEHLCEKLTLFAQQGFAAFMPSWQAYDLLAEQLVCITQDSHRYEARAQGVNMRGELVVKTAHESFALAYGASSVSMVTKECVENES